MSAIPYSDFDKVEIRVGRIIRAEEFSKAKPPAYKLWIDFGDHGVKTSSARITKRYARESLLGRLVLAATNLEPRKVVDFVSEVLVLGAVPEPGDVILARLDEEAPLGGRIL